MAAKVGMVSLGCPKNQVDAERMMFKLREHGFELKQDAALADVVIVNTCGFIKSAKQEAIETILEFLELKKEGRIKAVICSGCLAERYKDEIMQQLPELDAVVGLGCDGEIADIINKVMSGESDGEYFADKLCLPLDGSRVISTQPFYAYLKIAEGCSNCCTYCAIPSIRGKYRSRSIESILDEAKWLAKNGVTELVVVAQDTTRYGEDLYGESRLPQLLRELCKIDEFRWIRTLYLYPERITDEIIDVIASEPKLVKYMDIPIQHCNGELLKRMNRSGDRRTLTALMKKIRAAIPDVTIRTTLITGFPGETEEQFNELSEFIGEIKFDRLGCFAYSEEEGTAAAGFADQIDEDERQRRSDVLTEQQMFISDELNERLIGSTLEVVVEGFDRYAGCCFGRSAKDAPEIDGKIFFSRPASGKRLTAGDYVKVEIEGTLDCDLLGTAVE
ncbi:MAG: 30S ribosomal protein S12 methylthiotransferase RimO [Ruminococcus sp.]|nr:30S ribosomal protein S12 methylthiotransferase RimO [Ruminococcus sp.]